MNEDSGGIISWLDGLPGQAVFVLTQNPTIFGLGTIEQESDNEYLVTYPHPAGGPRLPGQWIQRAHTISADIVENAAESPLIYQAGRRLMHPTGRGYAEVLEVAETLERQARTFLARRLRYECGKWVPDEEWRSYPIIESYPAHFLARAQTWRYHQPVDPYFDVIAAPIGASQAIDGAAEFVVGGVTVGLNTRLVLSDLSAKIEATVHPTIANLLSDLEPHLLVGGTLRYHLGAPSWIARHVSIAGSGTSWSFDGGLAPGRIDLTSPWISVTLAKGKVGFTREIFEGIGFEAFTDKICRREPPLSFHPMMAAPDCIRLTLYERPSVITDHQGPCRVMLRS